MDVVRSILPSSDVNHVVYHANCSDGSAAAFCAYLMHGDNPERINYYAAKHLPAGKEDQNLLDSLDFLRGKGHSINMLIVDFCYPRDFLFKLRSKVNRLIVLDHHVTAMKEVGDLDFCYFDMNRSGAMLAWDYFFPNRTAPLLVQYIQDRDIWKWELPQSVEFSNGLDCYYAPNITPLSKFTDFILPDGSDNLPLIEKMKSDGLAIKTYVGNHVAASVKYAYNITTTSGLRIAIANETHYTSVLGNALAKEYDIGLLFYFDLEKNTIKVSLRSIGDRDCSSIAKQFGGGGHKNASGFVWERSLHELITALKTL